MGELANPHVHVLGIFGCADVYMTPQAIFFIFGRSHVAGAMHNRLNIDSSATVHFSFSKCKPLVFVVAFCVLLNKNVRRERNGFYFTQQIC